MSPALKMSELAHIKTQHRDNKRWKCPNMNKDRRWQKNEQHHEMLVCSLLKVAVKKRQNERTEISHAGKGNHTSPAHPPETRIKVAEHHCKEKSKERAVLARLEKSCRIPHRPRSQQPCDEH